MPSSISGLCCPRGQYTNGTQCSFCPGGRYNDMHYTKKVVECTPCPSGKFSVKIGAETEEGCAGVCGAGRYGAESGLVSGEQCRLCQAGQFNPDNGQVAEAHRSCLQ